MAEDPRPKLSGKWLRIVIAAAALAIIVVVAYSSAAYSCLARLILLVCQTRVRRLMIPAEENGYG